MQTRKSSTIIIDPTQMNVEEAIVLNYTLQHQPTDFNFFEKGELLSIPVALIENDTKMDLTGYADIKLKKYSILKRTKNSDNQQVRYEILNERIGEGGFGKVFKIIDTLIPLENHQFRTKHNKIRVAKEMISDKLIHLKRVAEQEYSMTKRDESLSAKKPVYTFEQQSPSTYHSFMVMNFLSGKEASKIFYKDRSYKKSTINDISTDERIKISIAISRALEKVHLNNIIHGDIKANNIILDRTSPFITAKVIDFGGSIDKKNYIIKGAVFTSFYAAYEILNGESFTEMSDVYSSSWIFNDIWRGDDHPAKKINAEFHQRMRGNLYTPKEQAQLKDKYAKKAKKEIEYTASHCNFHNLFEGISDLSKDHRVRIESMLKKISKKTPHKRGNFEQITEVFEEISLERAIDQLPKVSKFDSANQKAQKQIIQSMTHAHLIGIALRKALDEFARYQSTGFTLENLNKIKALFIQNIGNSSEKFSDDDKAIPIFIERLRVTAFVGLTTKKQILTKVVTIVNEYIESINELQKIVYRLTRVYEASDLFKEQLDKANSLLNNCNHEVTIDVIAARNAKFKRFIEAYQKQIPPVDQKINANGKSNLDKVGLFNNTSTTSSSESESESFHTARNFSYTQ